MSLINQVLKDIERRQASLQLEEPKLYSQLRPVLSMDDSQWRFPTWLKLFIFGFLIGGLLYLIWVKVLRQVYLAPSDVVLVQEETAPPAHLDWQVHPQLTKTLSSDWRTKVDATETSSKSLTKAHETAPPAASKTLPTPKLNQAGQLKLADAAVLDTKDIQAEITEKAEAIPKPAESVKTTQMVDATASAPATGKQANAVMLIKPADPNFSSSITPAAGIASTQVVKKMKPEQEANQYLQRAIDMQQKGRVTEAIDATKKALSLAPQSEVARQLLATYLTETKQTQEAIQVLQSGLLLQPKQLGLRKALAKLQRAEGQQEKALETLQQGAEQATVDGDYAALWALTLQKANKHHAALPLFEQALASNPGQVQWLVAYAVSLQADGRSQDALKQFQEAQNLPSSDRMSAFIQQRIQQLQNPS